MINMGKCYLCVFESVNSAALTRHVIRSHQHNAGFRVQCQFCGVTYSKWTSFKYHIRKKHANEMPQDQEDEQEMDIDDNPPDVPPGNERDIEGDNLELPIQGEHITPAELHQWKMAKFLLNIRETGNMTQKAVDLVVEGVDEIVKSHVNNIQAKVMDASRESPDPPTLPVNAVINILEESKNKSVFDGLNSRYHLDKFLNRQGGVNAEKLYLGQYAVFTKANPPCIVDKNAYAYYIPLEDELKQLLSHPELLNYVENPVVNPDDIIRDIRDGSWYKSHPLFSIDLSALLIVFYGDELQTTNVAGAKPVKFWMFYWLLGNIPPHLRSILRGINVYAIVRSSYIQRFGIGKILSQFVADIKKLREGLTFLINGERKTFRGSLLFVSADTPAAQLFARFKEGVGKAKCPCRRCTATRETLQLHFVESAFVLRNKETHEEQVRVLEDDTLTAEALAHWSKEFGVNGRSVFCEVEDFDVTQCFVHDPMHVFSEGVLPLEIRIFLKYIVIERRLVSLKTINSFIAAFNPGHLKDDKPASIETAHLENKLRQSSVQNLALGHILPFALKDRIESDSDAVDRLNNLVKLVQIIDLSQSYEFSEEDVTLLEHMISSHLATFKVLYPDVKLVPKHHFMIHFPRQIVQFGPLRYQSCIRFEATHAYFKRLMSIVLCYKNPPLTMLYRHCAKRANLLLTLPGSTDDRFLDLGDEVQRGPLVKVIDHVHRDILRMNLPLLRVDETVLNAKSITVKGIKYVLMKSVILLDYTDDDLPEFGRIELITVYGEEKILFYRVLQSLCFASTLNAYQVSLRNNVFGGISVRNLRYPHVTSVWRCGTATYVPLMNFKPEFMG